MFKQKQSHFHPNRSSISEKTQKYLVRISKYGARLLEINVGTRDTAADEMLTKKNGAKNPFLK
jgi:hypothetical protein